MFARPGGAGRRIREIAARFREKGATSPEKAMTIQELGLPPRFETAMKRRLGATGIFVEVSGRYYLDEARLAQFEQQRAQFVPGEANRPSRETLLSLRMARMAVGVGAIILVLVNILIVRSLEVTAVVASLLVLWVALTVLQFYYLARLRSSWRSGTGAGETAQRLSLEH